MFENQNQKNIFDVGRAKSKECIRCLKNGKQRKYWMVEKYNEENVFDI
jgi:hypothetical protein